MLNGVYFPNILSKSNNYHDFLSYFESSAMASSKMYFSSEFCVTKKILH